MYNIEQNSYIDGYFINERFIPKNFLDYFDFCKNISDLPFVKNKLRSIENSNSVSIHIRRTDYLIETQYQNICTDEYYEKAMSYIRNNVQEPVFYFFSDGLDWCKEKYGTLYNCVFVDSSHEKKPSVIDLFLMSKCKHNIIANSTFSWWGAYLNNNKSKMVLCPSEYQKGAKNIYCKSWICIY